MDVDKSNSAINSTILSDSCSNEHYWFAFLFSSLATFLFGVIAIGSWRMCACIYKRRPMMRHRSRRLVSTIDKQISYSFDGINERNWATMIKEYAAKLISGQQLPGKILVCINRNKQNDRFIRYL